MYKCTECNEQHEEKEKVVTENLVLIENQEDIAEVN